MLADSPTTEGIKAMKAEWGQLILPSSSWLNSRNKGMSEAKISEIAKVLLMPISQHQQNWPAVIMYFIDLILTIDEGKVLTEGEMSL